jgi:uncharacterized protein YbjT (DUF2867 family)
MDIQGKIILVTGATGRQGGAVAEHLLADGWRVRGLTRTPNQPRARELEGQGVEMFQGDLNTITEKDPAFEGVYGIFSVQNFWEVGEKAEIAQGKRLADIADKIHVEHFVYSSVGGAERNTGIAHFDSKWQIEQHIRKLALPSTILRPVVFMDNFNSPEMRHQIVDGTLRLGMHPDRRLQMIAVTDIGAFAARVFMDPDQYLGKAFELAGDELTMPHVAEKLGKALGIAVTYEQIPLRDIRKSNADQAKMFEWFNRYGYQADIRALREQYPPLLNFDDWLQKTQWAKEALEEAVAMHY